MIQKYTALFAAAVVAALLAAMTAHAQPASDLFKGKDISLLIGAGAGGGADTYGRVLARHYGRLLPGNPQVVAKNVPGAGGLKLANQLYNVSPKDGTEIATFATYAAMEPLFGSKEAKFETTKFTWIGNMDSDATACGTWKHTGVKTWQDIKNRETTFGASGPSSATSIHAKIVGALLGARVKVIHGYQGVRTSMMAMERGELDGVCGLYMSTFRAQFMSDVEKGNLVVWMTFGKDRTIEFPDVPTVYEAVTNNSDRQLAELIFGQDTIGRPISAPPGLSPERTDALRSALMATLSDAAFLDDAKRAGLSIQPMDGRETQRQYERFYEMPQAVVARAMEIIGGRAAE